MVNRIPTPSGYSRVALPTKSFGFWLRHLPLKPGKPPVLLFNGQEKGNQSAHFAVVDVDVGRRDLQQCADAVMRLRSEYLFASSRQQEIGFKYTSGDYISFARWSAGEKPVVKGNAVYWAKAVENDTSYESFRKYIDQIFIYAGSHSLSKEMLAIDASEVQPGDVFIQGGFPGHAVIVVDVASNENGKKAFLLAQSYMPAQEIHILMNPTDPAFSPWYNLEQLGNGLVTPEWTFSLNDLKRFSPQVKK